MDGSEETPAYTTSSDGSGKIEWNTLEELGRLDKDFAIGLAQATRDYTLPAREGR